MFTGSNNELCSLMLGVVLISFINTMGQVLVIIALEQILETCFGVKKSTLKLFLEWIYEGYSDIVYA